MRMKENIEKSFERTKEKGKFRNSTHMQHPLPPEREKVKRKQVFESGRGETENKIGKEKEGECQPRPCVMFELFLFLFLFLLLFVPLVLSLFLLVRRSRLPIFSSPPVCFPFPSSTASCRDGSLLLFGQITLHPPPSFLCNIYPVFGSATRKHKRKCTSKSYIDE